MLEKDYELMKEKKKTIDDIKSKDNNHDEINRIINRTDIVHILNDFP